MSRARGRVSHGPTLDGEPARVHFPREGRVTVETRDGRRRAQFARDVAGDIMRTGGAAFQSPAFARPRVAR